MHNLTFRNKDARPKTTELTVSLASVEPIMAWYGAYYAGDRYKVFLDSQRLQIDQNGEWVRPSEVVTVTADSLVEMLRTGKKMAPVFWTTETGQTMYGGGYCHVRYAHTFVQYTPKTVGIECSPAIAGAHDAIKTFGDQWVEVRDAN